MKRTFYVTTPIYYPNDLPHVGHAYTTILADTLARWYKLNGYDVFFLTGTDEHGLKLQRAAEKEGLQPKEFVDKIVPEFKKYWKMLDISYDRFIRTTDFDHEEVVKKVYQELYNKGYIYKDKYSGWYCASCEKFYSEGEYVEENGNKVCPIHKRPLEFIEEETYFLKLSAFEKEIINVIENSNIIVPEAYAKEVVNRIRKEGLKDLSVARPKSRLSWGIELPFDKNYVAYVWIDALLNYLTGIGYLKNDETFDKYWKSSHHIIGKDILWFHSIIWFSILRMLGLEVPNKLIVHAFIIERGLKMGKSTGNVVPIDDLLNRYGSSDVVRYLLMRLLNLEKDVEFSFELLDDIYNGELIDNYGNLVRRVGILALKLPNGIVRKREVDKELERIANSTVKDTINYMFDFKIAEALVKTFDLLRSANAYLNRTQPWKSEDPEVSLYNTLEILRISSNLLVPVMPNVTQKVARSLGFQFKNPSELAFGEVQEYKVEEAPILFKKIS